LSTRTYIPKDFDVECVRCWHHRLGRCQGTFIVTPDSTLLDDTGNVEAVGGKACASTLPLPPASHACCRHADRALLCRGIEPAGVPSSRHMTSCSGPLSGGACGGRQCRQDTSRVRRGFAFDRMISHCVSCFVTVWSDSEIHMCVLNRFNS
jgi:hypothetical protein